MAITYMTEEGYKKMMEELNRLEQVERPIISAQIAEARDKGDLSENAEYDAAKEAQGLLEMKIAQLKDTLANARILDESMVSADSIQILSKVRVKDQKSGREMNYMLVSENEANIREGKLAITTPIAKALLGKKVGDVAEAKVPAGTLMLEILEISI
jgi:transcription elongation factor GreA